MPLLLASLAVGCTGIITDTKTENEDPTASTNASPTSPSWTTEYPRLTHAQYDATVSDLLYLTTPSTLSNGFVSDGEVGLFGNETQSTSVGESLAKDYENAATTLALAATSDAGAYAKLVPAEVSTGRDFVERFLPRCYRRPVAAADVDAYVNVFDNCPQEIDTGASDDFQAGVSCVIRACLQDPNFLYRVEHGLQPKDGVSRLTPHEIASRLSYLLWSTMPSDELFERAESGGLESEADIQEAALEMVADPRAEGAFVRFHSSWLELDGLENLALSSEIFPAFVPGIGSELRDETERFVEAIVSTGGSYGDLLTSTEVDLTPATAAVYGVAESAQNLPASERAGVLTRAAFLAKFSDGNNTAPILRGRWFKDRVLCKKLQPPKGGVPEIGVPEGVVTMREFVEQGTACGATCHQVLNPPGFALEQYDALGVFRTQEQNGLPIDPLVSYLLDGVEQPIDGGVSLSQTVADSLDAQTCYMRHWIQFVFGRPHGSGDFDYAQAIAQESLDGKLAIREILPRLVVTPAFLNRVVAEPEEK
jgi:hypothetical protein